MVCLIGGAPRVGKSIAAKRFAEKRGIKPISTDDLVEKVKPSLSEEEKLKAFPWECFSGDSSENTLTCKERVNRQEVCARSLEPKMDRLIGEAVKDGHSLVIEGVPFSPTMRWT